jgi:hypothetical protein
MPTPYVIAQDRGGLGRGSKMGTENLINECSFEQQKHLKKILRWQSSAERLSTSRHGIICPEQYPHVTRHALHAQLLSQLSHILAPFPMGFPLIPDRV